MILIHYLKFTPQWMVHTKERCKEYDTYKDMHLYSLETCLNLDGSKKCPFCNTVLPGAYITVHPSEFYT